MVACPPLPCLEEVADFLKRSYLFWGICVWHDTHVEAKGQLVRVSSFFPPCGCGELQVIRLTSRHLCCLSHSDSSEVVADFFEPSEGVLRLRVLHTSLCEGVGVVPDTAPYNVSQPGFGAGMFHKPVWQQHSSNTELSRDSLLWFCEAAHAAMKPSLTHRGLRTGSMSSQ